MHSLLKTFHSEGKNERCSVNMSVLDDHMHLNRMYGMFVSLGVFFQLGLLYIVYKKFPLSKPMGR